MVDPATAVVSGLFAGAVAVGVTLAIERWGGRLGGLVGTLPSTIVPAAIGIAAEATDHQAFRAAMFATPVGMLVNVGFLWLWRALPPRLPVGSGRLRLLAVLVLSLTAWAAAALGAVTGLGLLRDQDLTLGALAAGLTLSMLGIGGWACRRAPPAPRGTRSVTAAILGSRCILAGLAIGLSVALAHGDPLLAGMAAVFPAIFLTTMVSLWLHQGEDVQAGAVGPMMLGSTSVAAFALVCAWSIPTLGSALGAAVAWIGASVGVTLPCWRWLQVQPEAPAS